MLLKNRYETPPPLPPRRNNNYVVPPPLPPGRNRQPVLSCVYVSSTTSSSTTDSVILVDENRSDERSTDSLPEIAPSCETDNVISQNTNRRLRAYWQVINRHRAIVVPVTILVVVAMVTTFSIVLTYHARQRGAHISNRTQQHVLNLSTDGVTITVSALIEVTGTLPVAGLVSGVTDTLSVSAAPDTTGPVSAAADTAGPVSTVTDTTGPASGVTDTLPASTVTDTLLVFRVTSTVPVIGVTENSSIGTQLWTHSLGKTNATRTTSLYGGLGGGPFTDLTAYQTGGPLTALTVWLIGGLSLQAKYGNYMGDKHGLGRHVSHINMELQVNEDIVEVTVKWGQYVCSLTFTTSSSRVFGPYFSYISECGSVTSPFSSWQGGIIQTTTVRMKRLMYIDGRCGDFLDAIAFVYAD